MVPGVWYQALETFVVQMLCGTCADTKLESVMSKGLPVVRNIVVTVVTVVTVKMAIFTSTSSRHQSGHACTKPAVTTLRGQTEREDLHMSRNDVHASMHPRVLLEV